MLSSNTIIFLAIVICGVAIELLISQLFIDHNKINKKHRRVHFQLSRYIFLLTMPTIATLIMTYLAGLSVLKFFVSFAILGTLLEYCIGYSYQAIVGQRLWKYYRYSINGHTSLLSIPLWGLCGVLIYLIATTT